MIASYPSRRDPRIYVAAIIILIVVGVTSIAFLNWTGPGDGTELTILRVYTYDSFMLWGEYPDSIDNTTFNTFEEEHGVQVEIVRLSTDANGIVSRLVAEQANPVADVVIGIDNILILQNEAKSVLEPYTPSNLNVIDSDLISALDSEHYVIPFDFGLVTIIYSKNTINTTTHPQLDNLTFADLAEEELAASLVTENPQVSSPGLAFLLSEIAVQEKLVGEDWTLWWEDVKEDIDVQPGWSEAWAKWDTDPSKHLMVSYGTDPAYSSWWSGEAPTTNIAPIHYEGEDFAWVQVEGIGLVKNGPNPDLAKAFIEYCLTDTVQENIPLNQWMFPASSQATLPAVYDYAIHPEDISLLNNLLTSSEISANLADWLDEWALIMTG